MPRVAESAVMETFVPASEIAREQRRSGGPELPKLDRNAFGASLERSEEVSRGQVQEAGRTEDSR